MKLQNYSTNVVIKGACTKQEITPLRTHLSLKMDIFGVLLALFAFLNVVVGQSTLKCIECLDIQYTRNWTFSGVEHVYRLLDNKRSIKCAQRNPSDDYEASVSTNNNNNMQFFQSKEPGQTICPALSEDNKCNLIFGTVHIRLPQYSNAPMTLVMFVRSCITDMNLESGKCYDRRNTQSDMNFLRQYLSFLGQVNMEQFYGKQCVCTTNNCYVDFTSGSLKTVGSISSISLLLLAVFSVWY